MSLAHPIDPLPALSIIWMSSARIHVPYEVTSGCGILAKVEGGKSLSEGVTTMSSVSMCSSVKGVEICSGQKRSKALPVCGRRHFFISC